MQYVQLGGEPWFKTTEKSYFDLDKRSRRLGARR